MEEYEYSFKVQDIRPYIEYCESNKYKLVSSIKQNRLVYENIDNNKILARITEENKRVYIDFKNVDTNDNDLKISHESLPLCINDIDIKVIESILDVLKFKKVSRLYRHRSIYKKNDVIFEIDDYIVPKMKVVALEGKRSEVDKIYQEIINKIKN